MPNWPHPNLQAPPEQVERATVGRRVWFWLGADDALPLNVVDVQQPFDAGVLFVHHDGRVNLLVTDHYGEQRAAHGVTLRNPDEADCQFGMAEGYATWKPYQRKQQATTAAIPS